jgi:uncharacterized damage-inducible protein DinB
MTIIDGMLQELEQETQTTRRVLERVPADKLAWRPHAKARTLGQLAQHIAGVPGNVANFVSSPSPAQAPDFADVPGPTSTSDLLPELDRSVANAKKVLGGMSDATAMATWRLMHGDREVLAAPRVAVLRSIMLNHWYHHRGQLTVYLRQLGVEIPSIYGPSADENPFA